MVQFILKTITGRNVDLDMVVVATVADIVSYLQDRDRDRYSRGSYRLIARVAGRPLELFTGDATRLETYGVEEGTTVYMLPKGLPADVCPSTLPGAS